MAQVLDRNGARTAAPDRSRRGRRGPVVLATFAGTPFEPEAARLAVEAALETGAALLVVDVVEIPAGRRGAQPAADPVPPAVAAALRAPARLARDLGVAAQSLWLPTLRPVAALVALVAHRRAALVVFAPDPAALRRFGSPSRRRARAFRRALERDAPCLLWTPTAQEPVAGAVSSAERPSSPARPAPIRRARPGSATTMPSPSSSQTPTTNGKRL
jgi:hypothetical protein